MTSKHTTHHTSSRSGFTLVEIMIVVVIIGLLAAMALPAFQKARINSYSSRLANDFRTFAGVFQICAFELGVWPEDGNGNNLPESARPYFEGTAWSAMPPTGGYWDWEVNRNNITAAVALVEGGKNLDPAVYLGVDGLLDDGNLATGFFQKVNDRYLYILEE